MTDGLGQLPEDFVWGVSSSGFQSEGPTTDSNWNHYVAREGKQPYRDSVDFYNRYASDIRLAAELGVNTYRISINWTRVQPAPGHFSEERLHFYDLVLAEMRRHKVRPLITLNHWDYPMWVYRQGGWASQKPCATSST
jgi:beta-glucosidase